MAIEQLRPKLIAEGVVFGEGIRWRDEEIVLSDMLGERVVAVDPNSGQIRSLLDIPNRSNGLVVNPDGSLLVLSMFDLKILKLATDGSCTTYADLSGVATGYLGDAVMHPNGDLYVDDIGIRLHHGETIAPIGRVILVKPDGSCRAVLENLAFPNGITVSADGKTLFLVQSYTSPPGITAYDIGQDGALTEKGLFATSPTMIDGIAPDDDGGIWACILHRNVVRRFDAQGVVTHEVVFDGFEPVACSIGGPGGATMCVVAMRAVAEGLDRFEELLQDRVSSAVFLLDVPYAKRLARP